MHVNRGLLFWGLAFLSAGVVALAIQQNVLDRNVMLGAWRLWPLILVAIGLSLVLSRTPYRVIGTVVAALVIGVIVGTAITTGVGFGVSCASGADVSNLGEETGTFGSSASLDWQMNCGTMSVSMAQGSGWTARTGAENGNQPQVDGSSDQLSINSSNGGGFLVGQRERWEVTLPLEPTYDANIQTNGSRATLDFSGAKFSSLSLHPNAGDVRVDLSNATVSGLDVQVNAGHTGITASDGSAIEGRIQVNAGGVDLCVPLNTGMRITSTGNLFGTNLENLGLTRNGDTWETSSYGSAQHTITLEVQGNVGGFNLNPSGGCK